MTLIYFMVFCSWAGVGYLSHLERQRNWPAARKDLFLSLMSCVIGPFLLLVPQQH